MSNKKILIIEDEEDIANVISMILESADFEVQTVLEPLNAIETAKSFMPDAILLDLTMPTMTGWEVFKKIRACKEFKNTPIAIVTAKAEEFDAVLSLHVMKANAYIAKPFGKNQLIDTVKSLVNVQ